MTLHENRASLCACVEIPQGGLDREQVIRYARARVRVRARARAALSRLSERSLHHCRTTLYRTSLWSPRGKLIRGGIKEPTIEMKQWNLVTAGLMSLFQHVKEGRDGKFRE